MNLGLVNTGMFANAAFISAEVSPTSSHFYLIALAGGEGTRFSPISTPDRPKQFCQITSESAMLSESVSRFTDPIPGTIRFLKNNVVVPTQSRYVGLVKETLPFVLENNIIGQSANRNTAPAIILAMQMIAARDPLAVVVCAPTDQWIGDVAAFRGDLTKAVMAASTYGGLYTFGIHPEWAEPGFGYIHAPGLKNTDSHIRVSKFEEKPSLDTALQYLDTGDYYWNSGMFVSRAMDFLNAMRMFQPEMMTASSRAIGLSDTDKPLDQLAIKHFLNETPSISIDVALMQKAAAAGMLNVFKLSSPWSDVGTWKSVEVLAKKGEVTLSKKVREVLAKAEV